MKRNTVVGVALGLMMMATVGTGAVNPKDDQNPSQAGKSSIYFYDVAATDTHGKGKLMVDVNQHTFVFNGQDFKPSAQIALKARAAGGTEFVRFATGKATPSGNLHISGVWEAGAAAEEVVAAGAELSRFSFGLRNSGWFVAKIACYYSTDGGVTWHESDHSDGIAINGFDVVALADLGVPADSLVKIHVIVVAGKDRTGSEVWPGYLYNTAYYSIWGTTGNPTLAFTDLL
jgi:hypothetical protein